ncbi:MAG: hypothetical protein NkDv07_0139 [Candidatus Improbicoccus devescovinae]|nr:MAG: hypothetical protein NkDv07_0139 [Candidatus Improbicoccus devescovinae]
MDKTYFTKIIVFFLSFCLLISPINISHPIAAMTPNPKKPTEDLPGPTSKNQPSPAIVKRFNNTEAELQKRLFSWARTEAPPVTLAAELEPQVLPREQPSRDVLARYNTNPTQPQTPKSDNEKRPPEAHQAEAARQPGPGFTDPEGPNAAIMKYRQVERRFELRVPPPDPLIGGSRPVEKATQDSTPTKPSSNPGENFPRGRQFPSAANPETKRFLPDNPITYSQNQQPNKPGPDTWDFFSPAQHRPLPPMPFTGIHPFGQASRKQQPTLTTWGASQPLRTTPLNIGDQPTPSQTTSVTSGGQQTQTQTTPVTSAGQTPPSQTTPVTSAGQAPERQTPTETRRTSPRAPQRPRRRPSPELPRPSQHLSNRAAPPPPRANAPEQPPNRPISMFMPPARVPQGKPTPQQIRAMIGDYVKIPPWRATPTTNSPPKTNQTPPPPPCIDLSMPFNTGTEMPDDFHVAFIAAVTPDCVLPNSLTSLYRLQHILGASQAYLIRSFVLQSGFYFVDGIENMLVLIQQVAKNRNLSIDQAEAELSRLADKQPQVSLFPKELLDCGFRPQEFIHFTMRANTEVTEIADISKKDFHWHLLEEHLIQKRFPTVLLRKLRATRARNEGTRTRRPLAVLLAQLQDLTKIQDTITSWCPQLMSAFVQTCGFYLLSDSIIINREALAFFLGYTCLPIVFASYIENICGTLGTTFIPFFFFRDKIYVPYPDKWEIRSYGSATTNLTRTPNTPPFFHARIT